MVVPCRRLPSLTGTDEAKHSIDKFGTWEHSLLDFFRAFIVEKAPLPLLLRWRQVSIHLSLLLSVCILVNSNSNLDYYKTFIDFQKNSNNKLPRIKQIVADYNPIQFNVLYPSPKVYNICNIRRLAQLYK